ncbi:cache domain-containing protein [Methylobacterium sp. 13MFTsu3.1M2]|uniref:cache domain-containing protein n=1 Tax=Methylobacterium sp. 13MFTsu3.1M2 TaxID=1502776 RepID=UPI0008F3E1FB|nr:cache domain-containing protein [Methylobacterium sp. 13MFTsu3.1M2]SFE49379.1 Cache domain-containing protein [Methylobacterium sp. 13MFTsu3.1M2]
MTRRCDGLSRTLLVGVVLLVLASAIPVTARRAPPPLHQAAEIEALVNRAADMLEAEGARAFDAFRRKGSTWRYGDVYLFVVDLRGIVLFNAAHPNREGHDLLHERDADGKQFHHDLIDAVTRFGSGWVDYMFPKPGQSAPSVKWSYVCATRVAGVEALVGAGVYVE